MKQELTRNEKIEHKAYNLRAEEIFNAEMIKKKVIYLEILGEPESYSRERKGRGTHFYNPKGDKMNSFRMTCLKAMSKEDYNLTRDLIETNKEYRIELNIKFYLPIPKGDSLTTAALKNIQIIKPLGRPDLDNYIKFLLDSLHEVFYNDDSKVYKISAEKCYSINPRTEIFATLEMHDE